MTNKTWVYNSEDIFQDIPDDPENVMLTIPEEISNAIGLKPGDEMRILKGDQGTVIIEKVLYDEDGNKMPSKQLNELTNK